MSPVELRFLGSGDAFFSGGRLHPCIRLDGAEEPLLLDCGSTALLAMKQARMDPQEIGFVVLSHLHGDHIAGLPFLIIDAKTAGRTRPLVVAGPPGTEQRLEQMIDLMYPGNIGSERPFELRFEVLQEGAPARVGPTRITPFAAYHESGAPAYSLRLQYGGRVIAYSGDTGWSDDLVAAAKGADLLVCEASFFDLQMPNHIDYRTLADKRAELECRRIVITHMGDSMLAHLAESEFEPADDGAVITL